MIPKNYFNRLLIEKPDKAAILTFYCALKSEGVNLSIRRFGELADLSKDKASNYMKEFEAAIEAEKQTYNKLAKPEEIGLCKELSNTKIGQKCNKNQTVQTQQEASVDTVKPAVCEVSLKFLGQKKVKPSRVHARASCKSPTKVGDRSMRAGRSLRDRQAHRAWLIENMVKYQKIALFFLDNLIEIKKRLIFLDGKKIDKAVALKVWESLYLRKNLIEEAINLDTSKLIELQYVGVFEDDLKIITLNKAEVVK